MGRFSGSEDRGLVTLQLRPVSGAGSLVLAGKVLDAVSGEPAYELEKLFAETVDGLLVHVCLRDELRQGNWQRLLVVDCMSKEGR